MAFWEVAQMKNSVSMTLEVSKALNEKLSTLAQVNGTSLDTILLKALTLYDVASDAKQKNQHIGILDAQQRVIAEVVGV
jgi:predicted transcriptional regulator